MTAGVLVGIAVGEAALARVPGGGPLEALVRLGGSTALAMLLAAVFGFGPLMVMVIQSAASTIVVAYGTRPSDCSGSPMSRSGPLFSQVLGTAEPLPRVPGTPMSEAARFAG